MNDITQKYSETELNAFVANEWPKALNFLKNRFGIAEDDCKDIFQESFIVLYTNIRTGKLENMTASLSTYFTSICKNKALEFLRNASRTVNIDSEMSLSIMDGEVKATKIDELLALDADDATLEARKDELVRSIVKNLPPPCDSILRGFYRDNLSMKTLAEMFNYANENSVKVTKHRCCEKFRTRYNELCNNLF